METLLILAAAAVAVLALAFVWVTSAREQRPPLRTRQEEELIGGDPEGLVASMQPVPPSPIDRDAPILEITAIEAALTESRLIEGRAVVEQVEEGAPPGGDAGTEQAKAREWTVADTHGPDGPGAIPRERPPR